MILVILQARCSSTRLPQKVLKPILGVPMLAHQIARVQRATLIDRLIVATSSDSSDEPLQRLCGQLRVECFRGSLNDVLDRYYQAALPLRPEHVVRLTGDCPLSDPEVIDKVIRAHLDSGADYTSNAVLPSYPDGLDVEVFKYALLRQAWREASLPSQREHVTLFMHGQPERFHVEHVRGEADLSHLRWTVDNPEDFELVQQIYAALYPAKPRFDSADVLALLARRPGLVDLNRHIDRNEGLKKSLGAD
ncbi:spore coat polysaccharide biosynthesis protein SpsF [Janthinobacterium sp. CG_23.3]|uniref:cytidylyltransferase domain-containing protein n=1 Tax=unclassified Janthinobacterium TaxID=2610881 RepID=UPI0004781316|nr:MULTISPECIES: glycosyltransferase family protein [unclassified Janthinobacterium]MEC5162231.1 spore coat polysaccharide biosynthesis protein SpsF [Janthinobacterium sp. CG_S6]